MLFIYKDMVIFRIVGSSLNTLFYLKNISHSCFSSHSAKKRTERRSWRSGCGLTNPSFKINIIINRYKIRLWIKKGNTS